MYRVQYLQDGRWLDWDRAFETERDAQALIDWIDIPTIQYRIVQGDPQ